MKPAQILILALAVAMLVAACGSAPQAAVRRRPVPQGPVTTKDRLPALASHTDAAWIDAATRLQAAGAAVIYYRGSARRASAAGEPWTGRVEGDILFLSPDEAVLIPHGTLVLGPDNAIKVLGPHRTFLTPAGREPDWHGLIPM